MHPMTLRSNNFSKEYFNLLLKLRCIDVCMYVCICGGEWNMQEIERTIEERAR